VGFFSAALHPTVAGRLTDGQDFQHVLPPNFFSFVVRRSGLEPVQRGPEQVQKIKTIVDVLKIPENAIAGYLNWGTFTLRDVVTKSGGASPIGNDTVKYRGSSNDSALNAGVLHFKAYAQASARFGLGQSGHQVHACRHRRTLRGLAACTSC
jgi:hypothetical protein